MMIQPINFNFILSNDYTNRCNILNLQREDNHQDNDIKFNLELAKKIIEQVKIDPVIKTLPEIILIGALDEIVWEEITKPFIIFIRSQEYFYKINIQCDHLYELEDNLNDKLNFCKDYQVNFILNLKKDNYKNSSIKNILEIRPLSLIKFNILKEEYKDLFTIYSFLNDLHVKNLNFLFEFFNIHNISNKDKYMPILFEELIKIKDFILKNFQENEIPLIPQCFNMTFLKLLIKNNEEKTKVQMFSFYDLCCESCSTLNYKTIFVNQIGQAFLCSNQELNAKNDLYLGYYDDNGALIIKQDLNISQIIYNEDDLLTIYPQSEGTSCRFCPLFTCCSTGCYSINRTLTEERYLNGRPGNIASKFYCELNLFLLEICSNLVEILDNEKNELFKNYLYGCSIKGLKGI